MSNAKWKCIIDISKEYTGVQNGILPLTTLTEAIAAKIINTPYGNDPAIIRILGNLQSANTENNYVEALLELYKFANTNRRIWIEHNPQMIQPDFDVN